MSHGKNIDFRRLPPFPLQCCLVEINVFPVFTGLNIAKGDKVTSEEISFFTMIKFCKLFQLKIGIFQEKSYLVFEGYTKTFDNVALVSYGLQTLNFPHPDKRDIGSMSLFLCSWEQLNDQAQFKKEELHNALEIQTLYSEIVETQVGLVYNISVYKGPVHEKLDFVVFHFE